MQTTQRLFLDWGITFNEPYEIAEKFARRVAYATKKEVELGLFKHAMSAYEDDDGIIPGAPSGGGIGMSEAVEPGTKRRTSRRPHTSPKNKGPMRT